MIGIITILKHIFRPKRLIKNPKKKLPINAPSGMNENIKEASSMVIFPNDNGLSSDVIKIIIGLDHASLTPNPIVNKFTIKITDSLKSAV